MTASHTIAVLTLDGFNEIDSFVATRMLDSVAGLDVRLAGPDQRATSAAGVVVDTPFGLTDMAWADAVVVGSGFRTFEHIENDALMADIGAGLRDGQLIGSQCSGAAFLIRLGLLDGLPVCTDRLSAARLEPLGVEVTFTPFRSYGDIATAGGCLSSAYLASWIIDRLAGRAAALEALHKVVPVGEEDGFVGRATALLDAP